MYQKFGIDSEKMGIDGRTITKGSVFVFEDDTHNLLTSQYPHYLGNKKSEEVALKDAVPHEGYYKEDELTTFWDESDFCVIMKKTDKNVQIIKDLKEAVKNKNFVITSLKSSLPAFENSSLSILIKSRLPQEVIDQMYFVDKKDFDLLEYEKEIGITDLKWETRNNGYKGEKYYCTCSPSWINYEDPEEREKKKAEYNTKYDIMFWVNYSDDDDNYGWYRAEDIIKWLSTPGLKLKSLIKSHVSKL
jgi:hypothetical protein